MARPTRVAPAAIDAWLKAHPGWERDGTGEGSEEVQDALVRAFKFPDFAVALSFVVRMGCWAERHDHHPDVELGWGRARMRWSTHDAGGITQLDLDGADACDRATGAR